LPQLQTKKQTLALQQLQQQQQQAQIEEQPLVISECNHTISEVKRSNEDVSEIPMWDFVRREKLFIQEKKKAQKESVPESALDILVLWETTIKNGNEMETHVGLTNLCHLSLTGLSQAESSSPSAQVLSKTKLRFTVHSSRKEIHDFSKQR